ncbi:MAG: hypothetical protein RLY21_701 [Planctomycetota bacterium]|jgi:hypothetical protein
MTKTRLSSLLAMASASLLNAAVSAQVVDINGGNSWSGWNSVGNSQTSGLWVKGSTSRTYDIYSTYFVLNAGQAVGGTRIANGAAGDGAGYTGDTSGSLFSDSWQGGDRIVGVGVRYTGTTRGSTFFFHKDAGGNNIFAASSFGANDGYFSHDVGDTSSYMSPESNANRGRVRQYSIWNGFSQNGSPQEGNFTFPYGQTPTLAMPTRSFTILDNGSMNRIVSAQYFINIDAILRSNGGATYGDGDFGLDTRFGFWEGDQTTGWDGTQFSQQIFSIPAPGAIALLGLAGVAGKRRRR